MAREPKIFTIWPLTEKKKKKKRKRPSSLAESAVSGEGGF